MSDTFDLSGQFNGPVFVKSTFNMGVQSEQPRFKKVEVETEDSARNRLPYFFGTRRSTFLGRKKELRTLERFLDATPRLSWIMVIGPGGSGKSRMALELLRDHPAWEAGFLDNLENVDWTSWHPTRDTLLVIDYARTRAGHFTRACSALYSGANSLEQRIRFLLLDRSGGLGRANDAADALKEAAKQFYGAGTAAAAIVSSEFAEHVFLDRLPMAEIWQIIKEAVPRERLSTVNRKAVSEALAASDPQHRPLFALFAADALREGRDVRQWSARALTQWVLDEERKRYWRPAEVHGEDLNLLALSTLVGGLSIEGLRRVTDGKFLPLPDQVSISKYEAISGRKVQEHLPPLEPDILGELFVIDHLLRDDKATKPLAPFLVSAAWRSDPAAMSQFLFRAMWDFGRPLSATLARAKEKRDPEDEAVSDQITRLQRLRIDDPPKEWLIYAGMILSDRAAEIDLSGYTRERQKIGSLYQVDSSDGYVSSIYAKALMGEIILGIRTKDIAASAETLKLLDTVLESFPSNPNVRDAYAKAVGSMLLYGYKNSDFTPIQLLGKISNLASRFPEDGELRKWSEIWELCVRITYPTANEELPTCVLCGRSVSRPPSEGNEDCLLCMLSEWALTSDRVLRDLTSIVHSRVGGVGSMSIEFDFFIETRNAREYTTGAWLRRVFSNLLDSVVRYSEDSSPPSNLLAKLSRLYELLIAYPDERDLLASYASALPSVIRNPGVDDLSISEALYMVDRLESRADSTYLAFLSMSKFAIVSRFSGRIVLAEILMYFGRAEQTFRTVPREDSTSLTYSYALAVFHILRCYEELGITNTCKELLNRLAFLSKPYTKSSHFTAQGHREIYAQALAIVIKRARGSGAVADSVALTNDLDALTNRYPDEKILKLFRQSLDDEAEVEPVPEDPHLG